MTQRGAGLVICQHSLCIGCFENYKGSIIIYGQGNFLFDHSDSDFGKTSLLIKASIYNKFQINYIPILKAGNGVCLVDSQATEAILISLRKRSDKILKESFVEQQYR